MIAFDRVRIKVDSFELENVSFKVPTGKYAVLMGKTGCGKTTLLEAICGLRTVLSGSIWLDGRDVTQLKTAERGIGYVPQDAALFNTMTVSGNLAFALKIRRWPQQDVNQRVSELAELLDLTRLLERSPSGLSGGERQRVAMGRALAFYPEILCLDEPLSSLDQDTRAEMYELLRSVKERTRVTVIHVTHDRKDADRLADCVFQISDGEVEQVAL